MKYVTCAFAVVAFVAGTFSFAPRAMAEPKIQTVWSVDVDQRLPNSPLALSQPAMVQHQGETWLVLGGRDSWVHVYDLDSGREIRRFPLPAPSDSGALALPNGWVVLGDVQGHLYAVDPVEGKIVWQKELTAALTIPPLPLGDDFLIQTGDNELYRFSSNGEKRWSYTGSKNTLSLYFGAQALIVDDTIYAVFNNGDAVALKAYTGDLIWKRQTILSSATSALTDLKAPLAQPTFLSQLHLSGEKVNDVLMVPIFQGEVVVLSSMDGSQSFDVPLSLKSSPLVTGEYMFMADSFGFLHAYNLDKGNRVWSKKISSHALMGPQLFHDSLWLTDNQGTVFKVNMKGEIKDMKQLQGSIARLPVVTSQGLVIRTDRGVMALVK
ncbi:MAG: PQQ-like beta-propeller repeat protein [Ghiorsea sp.]|nr:PQQ-like beta-propeller repeat protein [Ghiorsea sp.]